jgi:hypothetical protein
MRSAIATLTVTCLVGAAGCGGSQPPAEASADAPPPAVEAAPIGVGERIEASYEFGAWGPCNKQRLVYLKEGDSYSSTRICDDNGSQSSEVITAEQFRQAVFIEDYLPAAGRPMAELPAESFPERCPECTKCFRSPDEVATACQNSSGVVSYMFSNPAALGRTDSNTTRWLISYDER